MQIQEQILDKYHEKMRLRGFTADTKEAYGCHFKKFVYSFAERTPELPVSEIETYIDSLHIENENTQGVLICAIRFYYVQVLGRKEELYKITRAKKRERLHDILSLDEVVRLLRAIPNIKQRALAQTVYSCALRNREGRHIMTSHIDWKQSRLKVVGGKGKKDRFLKIPPGTLNIIRQHCDKNILDIKVNQPLFRGEKPGSFYCAKSLQNIVATAAGKAGITKEVTPHVLRHACATHWRNAGMQLDDIRDWLGHSTTKITEAYLHTGVEDREERLEEVLLKTRERYALQAA